MEVYGSVCPENGFWLWDVEEVLRSDELRLEIRDSSHYRDGEYLLVELGEAEFRIEAGDWPNGDWEYLIHAEADDSEAGDRDLRALAHAVSVRLTQGRLRHGIEIYEGEAVVEYLHHDSPSEGAT